MDEFDVDVFLEDEDPDIDSDDEVKLAEIYKLANRLIRLLEGIKSFELRGAAALMLIRELVENDRVLMGLAAKMLQDMSYGFEDDESYVS